MPSICNAQSTAGAITMISTQTEAVQAVLFHDRTVSESLAAAFKAFLQRLVQRFDQLFHDELVNLRPQLQPNAALSVEQVRSSLAIELFH